MAEVLYAEYASPGKLAAAIRLLRGRGYDRLEAYTPYPVVDVIDALGKRPSKLPVVVFLAGMGAAAFIFFLQWLLVAHLYPLDVGGRPPFMPLPFFIITFEMGVLAAVFAAFFGVLVKGRLLRLWDPVFEVDGFERTSIDRHWLRVEGGDRALDAERMRRVLSGTGAVRIFTRRAA